MLLLVTKEGSRFLFPVAHTFSHDSYLLPLFGRLIVGSQQKTCMVCDELIGTLKLFSFSFLFLLFPVPKKKFKNEKNLRPSLSSFLGVPAEASVRTFVQGSEEEGG